MLNTEALAAAGIDPEEGLAYCADDPEFYEEMLTEYVREADAGIRELARFFGARDWRNYGIRAHALKSTSRTIGAQAFSEQAREMEAAAKEGKEELLLSRHAAFTAEYAALADAIRRAIQ